MRGVTSTGRENYYRLIGESGGNYPQRVDNRTAALKFAALVTRVSSDTYDCLVKIIPNVFPGIDYERTHSARCIRIMYPCSTRTNLSTRGFSLICNSRNSYFDI